MFAVAVAEAAVAVAVIADHIVNTVGAAAGVPRGCGVLADAACPYPHP